MLQSFTVIFVLLCCITSFIRQNYFITQVLAINDLKSKYTDKSLSLHIPNLNSDKSIVHNTVNNDPTYNNNNNNNNNNNIQTMSKSSLKNKSQSSLTTSTNFLHNTSNSIERNFQLTNQIGGLGLVSSSSSSSVQNRISLDTLSHTTKTSSNIIEHNSPLLMNSLDNMKKSKNNQPFTDWPTSLASEEYSKINMRIMGQPIDSSVVSHLRPDVSPHKAKKLRKILSGSLDKEWTSETPPRVLRQRGISGSLNTNNQESYSTIDTKLLKEIRELNFTFRNSYGVYFTLTEEQIQPYRFWLIERATCEMDFIWEDLGPLFWPRWIRRGVCLNRPGHSCSWPSGMKCRPSGSRALQLLHWKCEDAAQVQTREHAADQRIRRRVSMNTFHSGFYEMEPVTDIIKSKQKRDTYARLSLKDNSLHVNSYRKLQARNLGNSHYHTKTSWINIKSSEPSSSSTSSSSSSSGSSSLPLHLDQSSKDERRRRRARRLIKRLSVTANGYHCYWQVQKYLISDRCSCLCS